MQNQIGGKMQLIKMWLQKTRNFEIVAHFLTEIKSTDFFLYSEKKSVTNHTLTCIF